jgi:serine/threonine-protein kinase HipA
LRSCRSESGPRDRGRSVTTSKLKPAEAYVWTWLPGTSEPVVAGRVDARGDLVDFTYALSYRSRDDAISLFGPELPLRSGIAEAGDGLRVAGALRDGSPDSWGRNVIQYRQNAADADISEIGYMLLSGSNRFGANDFQASPTQYEPRTETAPLDELVNAADRISRGLSVSEPVADALEHGTAIGGARPKVVVRDDDGVEWIAKLSASSDRVFSVVAAEAASMTLARAAGIRVPDTHVGESLGRSILFVRRFDRVADGGRRHVVSGLTIVGLDEMVGRYATYPDLLDQLRRLGATGAGDPGPELFDRITFSIAVGNSDDHARNHAAFWDGTSLQLTPAYDLAPNSRSGETATQAMAYDREGNRESQFAPLVAAARLYGLDVSGARDRVDRIVDAIRDGWADAVDEARMTATDRELMWGRQFLNDYAFYGY